MSCSAPDGFLVGNPILPATGEKIKDELDYSTSGPQALSLARHYSSSRLNVVNPATPEETALGLVWRHSYATALRVGTGQATLTFSNGNQRNFDNPSGSYTQPWRSSADQGSLTPLLQGPAMQQAIADAAAAPAWTYINPEDDSQWTFDAAGRPLLQTLRGGRFVRYTYNDARQLQSVTNTFGQTLGFVHNASGQLISVTTPDARTITYAYDAAGRLIGVSQSDGTRKSYLYENSGNPQALTGIVDEAGQRTTYVYDSEGRATSSELAGGVDRYRVSYAGAGGATVTDPLGTQRAYTYGTQKSKLTVISASQPGAQGFNDAATRIQDLNGLLTQETDFLGAQTLYTWDATRRLLLQTTQAAGRPEAQTTSTQWHPTFRLPLLVTEAGKTIATTYDALGNRLSQAETDTATGQSRVWAWTYNAQSLVETSTDPMGRVTRFRYDAQGNRISVTNPLNHETRYTHDGAGRVTQEIAPNGLQTAYSYDARGRLLSSATGSGAALETTTYTYHPTGQLATARLPSGLQAAYTYDAAQRLVSAADNRGNTITYTLDAMGNRVREEVKDASGTLALVTARIINNLNRVAAVQGAAGQATTTGFDANAQAISQTDPLNQTTRQTLDALRRPTVTTFADNTSAQQSWGQLDQLTQVKDPKGIATTYQRNAWGEVMAEASPDIGTTTYERNANGDITRTVDALGNTTHISRDALGRPVEVSRTNTTATTSTPQTTRYTWDQGNTGAQTGYLTKSEDPSGATTYERDAFGRTTRKTQTVKDNAANPSIYATAYSYANGQLASITYPSGLKVTYSRNPSGQITALSTQQPGKNKPVAPFLNSLTYTALGQPKAWTWASGDSAARVFDADGRMTANELASYTFDAASRITSITQNLWAARTVTTGEGGAAQATTSLYQTPFTWQASYDSRNRLTGFNRPSVQTSYSYDANANRLSGIDKTTSDSDLDGLYEPEDFTATSAQALSIDAASNRLQGLTQTFTKTRQNANGQPVTSTATTTVNYQVDAVGNLTSDGARRFDYDSANRLAQVKLQQNGEEAAIGYLHNAQGQRVFKSEPKAENYQPNETQLGTDFTTWLKKNFGWLFAKAQLSASLGTAYVYADEQAQLPSWAILGEYDNGSAKGAGRTEYLWLPTDDGNAIPVGMSRNGKLLAIHTDHLGTPRLLTNEQNTPVWQWPYSAFGNNKPTGILKATANPRAAVTNSPELLKATNPAAELNLRFPGQYADDEAGVFYNYFRNYRPGQGRYDQGDPIGLDGGMNRFGYVEGNALNATDPRGLDNPGIGSYGPYWTGVQICSRPVNISWVGGFSRALPQHNWLQTGLYEAGMGAQCPVPGQGCSDRPGSKTQTINHSGQSAEPGASCQPIPNVDEQCVSNAIRPGQLTGRWMPWNQCQSFAQSVIETCTTNGANRPFIGYPRP